MGPDPDDDRRRGADEPGGPIDRPIDRPLDDAAAAETEAERSGTATYRTLDNLEELAATIEAARGMPMSGSCVVHRATVLDLLDEVRAALPRELVDARDVLSERAELLHEARERAGATVSDARARARALLADAEGAARETVAAAENEAARIRGGASAQADELVGSARREGERVVSLARAEHERLISETEVRDSAARRAEEIVAAATDRAERLCADADAYVNEQLENLGATLTRMTRSVELGRRAIADRVERQDAERGGNAGGARVGAGATPSARDEFYDQDSI